MELTDIDLFPIQEKLLEEMITVAESFPTEPLTVADIQIAQEQFFPNSDDEGYTASEVLDAGLIYAPYIPLYVSPSVNVSDLKTIRFRSLTPTRYKIPKYNDIYSDIKERFELLDL